MTPDADRPRLTAGARWDGADLLLAVRVTPRAASQGVAAEADCLKIRLTSPPVEGKANQQLCAVLASLFRVPKSRVSIDAGSRGRLKRVRVVEPAALPEMLLG